MSLDYYTNPSEKKKKSKKSLKILSLEKQIQDLEEQKKGLQGECSQLVTECCNAILYLKKQNTSEEVLEKIFPFSRMWEDDFLLQQIEAVGFPLIFQEEEEKKEETS